ncbi:uncharacterized protein LOC106012173 [Aplysia californica]|uniref:Uncharacterized protein LOC106012173 n=1 Tax=Aplysia californica TaxID=6500 RepID=A0ABM1A2V4_APLCA|nr:uncharacterized protein LOC106012173 [Aplysia californica]
MELTSALSPGAGVVSVSVPAPDSGPQAESWTETAAFLLDRANVLHFSMVITGVNWTDRNLSAVLHTDGQPLHAPVHLAPLTARTNTYVAKGHLPLYGQTDLIMSLSGPGLSQLQVMEGGGGGGGGQGGGGGDPLISQTLPPLTRGKCLHSKIQVVGSGKSYWSPESAPLDSLYAVVSDHLKFVYDNNTSLYLFDSQEDWESCQFHRAQQLVPLDEVKGQGFFFKTLNRTGPFYFADSFSCNSSQPLRLVVYVADGVHLVKDQAHDEWCRRSVYQAWIHQQLEGWSEPAVSGPILIGLVVGLTTAGVFLAWHSIQAKKAPLSFPGSADNAFVRF